jgi:hypothetical protein
MGRENDLEGKIVSDDASTHTMKATYVREPVNAVLREVRCPSFSSVQIVQDSLKIRLSHERRRRGQTKAKRLAYCILAHRHERPAQQWHREAPGPAFERVFAMHHSRDNVLYK